MRHRLALALVLAAALAACQKKQEAASGRTMAAAAPAEAAAEPAAPRRPPVTVPELAYAYDYKVRAPARDVPGLVRQHESACILVGPTVCQVVGASTEAIGREDVSGQLELRATPAWIARFRERIEGDVQTVGGKIETSGTETEDLSRSLVDTEAAIRAKTVLRDRLQTLVRTHNGKLKDLVEIEHQLAQVQAEIDAARSELSVMNTRVQMARVSIDYRSLSALAPDSAFAPVKAAAYGFVRNAMGGVAFLVTAVSVLLPFGGAAWLIWIGVVRRRRKAAPV